MYTYQFNYIPVYHKAIFHAFPLHVFCFKRSIALLFWCSSRKWPLWKVMKFSSKETKATFLGGPRSCERSLHWWQHEVFFPDEIYMKLKISRHYLVVSYHIHYPNKLIFPKTETACVSPHRTWRLESVVEGDSFYLLIDGTVEVVKD